MHLFSALSASITKSITTSEADPYIYGTNSWNPKTFMLRWHRSGNVTYIWPLGGPRLYVRCFGWKALCEKNSSVLFEVKWGCKKPQKHMVLSFPSLSLLCQSRSAVFRQHFMGDVCTRTACIIRGTIRFVISSQPGGRFTSVFKCK